MKKLNKFEINPEKIIKNEELLILRGDLCYDWDFHLLGVLSGDFERG